MLQKNDQVEPNDWEFLRNHTNARIALGHTGGSMPTSELLAFRLAHAKARDAIYSDLETGKISTQLSNAGFDYQLIKSSAESRDEYLKNPDKGRKLNSDSAKNLIPIKASYDICVIIGDGLSARAVNEHAVEVLKLLSSKLKNIHWNFAPVLIAKNARVGLSDEAGSLLKAEIVLMLIGERPGLSSPDSMGAYITYRPEPGLTDERRNCVSNIRPEGLSYAFAADKIFYLLTEMKSKKISGVLLKERFGLIGFKD